MAITNIYKGDVERSDIQKIYKGTTLLYESMTYEDYARELYLDWGKSNQFEAAWESSLTVDQLEISADSTQEDQRGTAQYPNGETEGVIIPLSVTTIGDYAFYNWQSNNQPLVIPDSVTSIGIYAFGYWDSNNQPLVIPDSVTSIGSNAFRNWYLNNQPLVIPNSVTDIGISVFQNWDANNQPLVIPDSITSIGNYAFANWRANTHPLVIPDSVTSIGIYAFYNWRANTHPLVIPDSVTSIGRNAFRNWSLVPYIEMQSLTPPSLAGSNAFDGQNNAPIYVPDESVDDYKEATNWVNLASRIFSINDKE